MNLLGIEAVPFPEQLYALKHTEADLHAWPFLPQGVLEPGDDDSRKVFRLMHEMSDKERELYIQIHRRPELEWTRHERRFVRAMLIRDMIRHPVRLPEVRPGSQAST